MPSSTFVPSSRTTRGTARPTVHRGDDPGGDDIAAHDPTEDVHEYPLHRRVFGDDLEGGCHLLLVGAASDVEKVGRLAADVFDRVHGGHGQPGPVDQAADRPVELDVAEPRLLGRHLGRVLLGFIAHRCDIRMAEQGVVVEGHLPIEGHYLARAGDDQRVDLDQVGVELGSSPVEGLDEPDEVARGVALDAEAVGQLIGLEVAPGRLPGRSPVARSSREFPQRPSRSPSPLRWRP